jgi:hypothetical protein
MYPSDFETADSVVTRIDEPLFLGLPPLLAVILFLLLLAIAAGFFFFGRWHAGETGAAGSRTPEDIHRAILKASTDALASPSNELKARAETLRQTIWRHLGPVVELGKGVTGPLKALDEAIKGEKKVVKADPPPPAARKSHDHDHGGGCKCGKPQACTCGGAAAPASRTINQVYLGGAPLIPAPGGSSHGCGCVGAHRPDCHASAEQKPEAPKAEARPETEHMTGPEQTDALSRAIRQFHDHWSNSGERIRELREARKALL